MNNQTVSQDEWVSARKELLRKEKELTKLQEEVARQRRELPWVKVEKEYIFDTPKGKKTLAELFDGRSQLIVYHFMLGPGKKVDLILSRVISSNLCLYIWTLLLSYQGHMATAW